MDINKKKEEIRKRLNIAKYSRNNVKTYNDENDHNPLILEKCSKCYDGNVCKEYEGIAVTETCLDCDGKGVTGNLVKEFDNEVSALIASVDKEGWLTCPNCKIRFATYSKSHWTGFRHRSCGQKIILIL